MSIKGFEFVVIFFNEDETQWEYCKTREEADIQADRFRQMYYQTFADVPPEFDDCSIIIAKVEEIIVDNTADVEQYEFADVEYDHESEPF